MEFEDHNELKKKLLNTMKQCDLEEGQLKHWLTKIRRSRGALLKSQLEALAQRSCLFGQLSADLLTDPGLFKNVKILFTSYMR
jgi:hypothetical protein